MTGVKRMTVGEAFAEVAAERGVIDETGVLDGTTRYLAYHCIDDAVAGRETTRMAADPRDRGASDLGDAMDREDLMIRQFIATVGRPPNPRERMGAPVAGCVSCAREGGACAEHARRPGEPLALPPRSQWFTGRIHHGSPQVPYNLANSVK